MIDCIPWYIKIEHNYTQLNSLLGCNSGIFKFEGKKNQDIW